MLNFISDKNSIQIIILSRTF